MNRVTFPQPARQLETFAVEVLKLSHYRAAVLVAVFQALQRTSFNYKTILGICEKLT